MSVNLPRISDSVSVSSLGLQTYCIETFALHSFSVTSVVASNMSREAHCPRGTLLLRLLLATATPVAAAFVDEMF